MRPHVVFVLVALLLTAGVSRAQGVPYTREDGSGGLLYRSPITGELFEVEPPPHRERARPGEWDFLLPPSRRPERPHGRAGWELSDPLDPDDGLPGGADDE